MFCLEGYHFTILKYHRWAQRTFHLLTDELLTIIKDKAMLRVAFSFYKGDTMLAPNNGSKIIDHCRDIAWRLFMDVDDASYMEDDVVKLGNAVKNWIHR